MPLNNGCSKGYHASSIESPDTTDTSKSIKHPALQVQSSVQKNGIAYLSYDYQSLIAYNFNEPLYKTWILNTFDVPTNEILFKGTLNQKEVLCTNSRVFSQSLKEPPLTTSNLRHASNLVHPRCFKIAEITQYPPLNARQGRLPAQIGLETICTL